MSALVEISAKAPTPLMVAPAAAAFEKLRQIVIDGSGVDFLAKCGDVHRPADFVSKKDGVANRSWHKTGRAFDYDQTHKALVIASEPLGGQQFFRTFIRCADQAGRYGVKRRVADYRGFSADAYVFDFTAAAEAQKFQRIPAWKGWESHYNRREFWHYQFNPERLTWDAAMLALKGRSRAVGESVVGLNDRGEFVRAIQTALNMAGLLPQSEIDGVFGRRTFNAVTAFQREKGLDADGIAGPQTRRALGL